ncbi:MAG: gamma-glutamylcyclotransferase family protein, partial [Alphaproteobacteria bacterium]
ADGWRLVPAWIAGWRRGREPAYAYPFLVPAAAGIVEGIAAEMIDAGAAADLTLYEGEGYRTEQVAIRIAGAADEAWLFLPRRPVAAPLPWSLADWSRAHKARSLAATVRWRAGVDAAERERLRRWWLARAGAGAA